MKAYSTDLFGVVLLSRRLRITFLEGRTPTYTKITLEHRVRRNNRNRHMLLSALIVECSIYIPITTQHVKRSSYLLAK